MGTYHLEYQCDGSFEFLKPRYESSNNFKVRLGTFFKSALFHQITNTTVIPGFKRPRFFFYSTTLILTYTINFKHVDVNVQRVTKTYFWGHPLFKLRPECPVKSFSIIYIPIFASIKA